MRPTELSGADAEAEAAKLQRDFWEGGDGA